MPSRTALLRLYYFVYFAAVGVYNPFFPTWLRARGIQGLSMSTITALSPLLGIVAPIAFGVAADAFSLRGSLLRVATLGALISTATMAALCLTGDASHPITYPALFFLVAVFAFFRAPMGTMADVTALEDPGRYGRTRLFGSLGFATMVVAAGLFVDPRSPAMLPMTVAAGLALTFLVTLLLPTKAARPAAPVLEDAKRLLRSADFLVFLLSGFFWYAAHVSYDLCFSLHLSDLGATPAYVGWCWAFGVAVEVALMSSAHHLLARAPLWRFLAISLVSTSIRFALISSIRNLDVLFLLQPLHALSFALFWMTALEYVKQRAPANVLATAQSLFSVSTACGSVAGMLVWGPLYAKSGGSAVFGGAAAVAAVGCLAALSLSATSSRQAVQGSSLSQNL